MEASIYRAIPELLIITRTNGNNLQANKNNATNQDCAQKHVNTSLIPSIALVTETQNKRKITQINNSGVTVFNDGSGD